MPRATPETIIGLINDRLLATVRSGFSPTSIYLGIHEFESLLRAPRALSRLFEDVRRNHGYAFDGVSVYAVNETEHLEVFGERHPASTLRWMHT